MLKYLQRIFRRRKDYTMPLIVVDLEWNQAMSAKSSVFNHLPIHLRGEIIQIGAVKLRDDYTPGEEFQCDVSPVWFRKMHYKVKKLTGFDNARLAGGLPFPTALEQFLAWCGPDCTFMTWGYDDSGIMEQNCIIHDLDIDWMGQWINLQLIYNMLTEDEDRNQKSLETAMEHFGIEQTRVAHDALGDAYNTALVCSRLDLARGLKNYGQLIHQLSRKPQGGGAEGGSGPKPIEHSVSASYPTREALWQAAGEARAVCPVCGMALDRTRWISQGDHRYMSLAQCPDHGAYLCRIRLRQAEDGSWYANRLLYQADEEMVANFNAHQSRPRRRRRRGKSAN